MNGDHPAIPLQPSVVELRRRASLAVIAFGAVMLVRTWDFCVRQWSIALVREIPADGAGPELMARLEHSDGLINGGNIAITITFVVAAVVFLRWVHRLVALTNALGGRLQWMPSQAVASFFIPLVSLIRPYQVLSAAYAALAPDKVVPPPPRADPLAQGDYRSVAFIEPSPVRKLPPALIAPWWASFLVMSVSARIATIGKTDTLEGVISAYQGSMFVSAVSLIAAALAISVVRGLTARLEERFRRIRESTPESLTEQNINV